MGDAGGEGGLGVVDLDGDGADGEAVFSDEGEAGGGGEGGNGSRAAGAGYSGGVRGGEEEIEVAGAEEVGGVD